MENNTRELLEQKARRIRYLTVDCIGGLGVGHVGGCLSVADVLAVLYFDVMNIDPKNPMMEGRDRFVMSKGHAGPAVYAALAERGYFPIQMLKTLNQPNTNLPSHCDMLRTPGIDMTAGSLGQGFSCAVGIAKAAQIRGGSEYTYSIVGDGECQEGQIWEAAMAAAHYQLDHFIAFMDYNKAQIDGAVDEIMSLGDPAAKFEAFGFFAQRVDGHDVAAIGDAIAQAKAHTGRPSMIVLDTVKGKGAAFAEKAGVGSHNMPVTPQQREDAMRALEERWANHGYKRNARHSG